MPKLSVNGVNLYYQDAGDGPPLLLIAGLTSDGASWAPIISALTEKYRVISPDNRGCGRTLPPPELVTIDGMVDDAAALLEHLQIPKANVLGHSMGGVIAMALAAKHPTLVNRLALMATAPKINARGRSIIDTLIVLREAGAPDDMWQREFFHWLFDASFFENKNAVDASIALAVNYTRRQSTENMRAQVNALRAYDVSDRLSQITAPALILGGESDLLFPPGIFPDAFADLRDKRFQNITGAAHSPHWDKPEETVAALNDFFGVV